MRSTYDLGRAHRGNIFSLFYFRSRWTLEAIQESLLFDRASFLSSALARLYHQCYPGFWYQKLGSIAPVQSHITLTCFLQRGKGCGHRFMSHCICECRLMNTLLFLAGPVKGMLEDGKCFRTSQSTWLAPCFLQSPPCRPSAILIEST